MMPKFGATHIGTDFGIIEQWSRYCTYRQFVLIRNTNVYVEMLQFTTHHWSAPVSAYRRIAHRTNSWIAPVGAHHMRQ